MNKNLKTRYKTIVLLLIISCLITLSSCSFFKISSLSKKINNADPSVRKEGASGLGEIKNRKAVELLISVLGDEDKEVREMAKESLVKIGENGVELLIESLKNENWKVKEASAEVLGNIGDARSIDPLILALEDEGLSVQMAARSALVKIGEPAVDALIKALNHEKWNVKEYAAYAFGVIGDTRALKPLVNVLGVNSDAPRLAAAKSLARIGEPAFDILLEVLKDGNLTKKGAAVYALGEMGDIRAIPYLIDILSEGEIVSFSAEALAKIGETAVEALIEILKSSDKYIVKQSTANALGKIGDARAINPLINCLGDENYEVRRAVQEALGHIGEPAVKHLIGLLGDEDGLIKWGAVDSLANIGKPAISSLMEKLDDNNEDIRWIAADALVKIGRRNNKDIQVLISFLDKGDIKSIAEYYPFYIKFGKEGTETLLIQALNTYGNKTMCLDYLNCGSDIIDEGARIWAVNHGYSVYTASGYHEGPSWHSGGQ